MDELQKIAKELEEHPLQYTIATFDKKNKPVNKIGEIKARIIRLEKTIVMHKKKIKETKLKGRERAMHITMQRARIKAIIKLITIELENLCNI